MVKWHFNCNSEMKIAFCLFIKSLTYLNIPFDSKFGDNNEKEIEAYPWQINRILKCFPLLSLRRLGNNNITYTVGKMYT